MADTARVMADLRRELSTQIQKIAPVRMIDASAAWAEHNPTDGQDIRAISPTSRVFQIGDFVQVTAYQVGGNHRSTLYDLEITFAYPSSEKWGVSAHSDMMQIDSFLLGNPSVVEGVAGRWVSNDKPLRVEQSTEDAKKFFILTVACHLETTF